MAHLIVPADVDAPVLACSAGISFWGGVDPRTGKVVDAHHPQHGEGLAGRVVMMPTSRGSCTGSAVLLGLALAGTAPAALVFREDEDILTLGALVAARMFDRPVAVVRLGAPDYALLAAEPRARIAGNLLLAGGLSIELAPLSGEELDLSGEDRAMLAGRDGPAARLAMEMVCAMAAVQGARRLTDVSRVHIDGCIYASPACLTFAEAVAAMAAKVRVPTTTNAISVDRANWRAQRVPEAFGGPASRLADAYVAMGARPSFTCAPYLLDDPPRPGEAVAWAESNAVVYANTVLGARTVKHPDFLDLFIALTGRAPLAGVYLDENRAPRRVLAVDLPEGHDESVWPMLGWLIGSRSPDRIPLVTGLETSSLAADDLKALCAAFGTTSAAPMLHIAGVTPEADTLPLADGADRVRISRADLRAVWQAFNRGGERVDLVALGSPHLSLDECRAVAAALAGRRVKDGVSAIVTLGRATAGKARAEGLLDGLAASGVQVVTDLCWCSISEPVFPPATRVLMTNSGKYAHYGPGLSRREVRFGSLADCAAAAVTGRAPKRIPHWLR
ncbi:aconitase X [Microbaculum marinum]|uniref:Aconitase X n=1 Tax=Microbaculum marinum TaxID=1764581 RepID=A0AAW9S298_9HYPH